MRKAVLLHFINRDIRENSGNRLTDSDIEDIVFVSLFMSSVIYAELTFEIEGQEDIPDTIRYLEKLNNLGIVTAISCTETLEELIIGRRTLYKFDEKRYPFYFRDNGWLFFPENALVVDSSTTKFIESHLRENHQKKEKIADCKSDKDLVDYIVTSRLNVPEEQALTIRSFDNIFNQLQDERIDSVKRSYSRIVLDRELAVLHTRKYLESTYSSIIKNIPFVRTYDGMDFEYIYDFPIYATILEPVFKKYTRPEMEEKLILWRLHANFKTVIDKLYSIVFCLQNAMRSKMPMINNEILSSRIVEYTNEKKCEIKHGTGEFSTVDDLIGYLNVLGQKLQISWKMERNMEHFNLINEQMKNILLPVANMTEFKNIIQVCEEYGFILFTQIIGNNTFHIHHGEHISLYIVKCEAGSLGASSSILTLTDAISNINIDTIIFSGIAFGNYKKRENGQCIGDIIVSKQLWNYESGKIADKFISRGDKCSATPWLLDRFQNSALDWGESTIHFGTIASGEKLSNSEIFIQQLMESEPEIIGGEMEGAGLVSVAERYKKDWILVKGISDWGMDKTDVDQVEVARKTFRYVFRTISNYFI